MTVGIDARRISYPRGIGKYVRSLLCAMAWLGSAHEFIVYLDCEASRGFIPAEIPSSWRFRNLGKGYVYREQVSLPVMAARDGVDLLHCTANTAPLLRPRHTKLLVTIHDVMYLMPPALVPRPRSTYQRLGRWYRRLIVPIIAKQADAIATVSHDSACGIERYLGANRDRITIIHEAAAEEFRRLHNPSAIENVRRRYGIVGKFILALGGLDPRKNTARVIEAFAGLRNCSGTPQELVIAGIRQRGHMFAASLSRLGPEQRVTFAGFVSNETLVALYNATEALLYPSIYEGFGLPVLEAMACGTPVICSRTGSLPEVAGDAALFVDPHSQCDIARALLELSTDESLRELLVRRGLRQAREFSWHRSAKKTLELYDACLAA